MKTRTIQMEQPDFYSRWEFAGETWKCC